MTDIDAVAAALWGASPGGDDPRIPAWSDVPESSRTKAHYRRMAMAAVGAVQAPPLTDVVRAFIAEREQVITALENCSPDNMADYWRWQGHAEARRVLAEAVAAASPQPATEACTCGCETCVTVDDGCDQCHPVVVASPQPATACDCKSCKIARDLADDALTASCGMCGQDFTFETPEERRDWLSGHDPTHRDFVSFSRSAVKTDPVTLVWRTVPCPTCHAIAGLACEDENGYRRPMESHPARREAFYDTTGYGAGSPQPAPTTACPGCHEPMDADGDCDNHCRRNEAIEAEMRKARRVQSLGVAERDRVWRDTDGDEWKFIDATWRYRRPGADADEWEDSESAEVPRLYGPFVEVVGES